jgi:hypothetical protein
MLADVRVEGDLHGKLLCRDAAMLGGVSLMNKLDSKYWI